MKWMIASDLHGSAYYCRKMLEAFEREGADRLFLLGDLLYHGPRNDLPREYAPKEVIPLLNGKKEKLLCVRGNCDAEVDQMVLEFPVRQVRLSVPKWLEALDEGHYLVQEVLTGLKKAGQETHRMRETNLLTPAFASCSELDGVQLEQLRPGEGRIDLSLTMKDGMFNRILGEECGTEIHGDKHLLRLMKELVAAKTEYDQIAGALKSVRETGYGLVSPTMAEMTMEAPEIVRQGGQFGIRLKAHAPSLHLVRVDIETEVTPTVGTEEQSEELARQMSSELESDPQKMWAMSFFGKPLSDMVREGLNGKLMRMPADAQEKVQETLTRIINDGDGGMICILL